jgi:signal transduction histidine kinase
VETDAAAGLLVISIHDNGKGMDEDESRKAADPFYSSKARKRFGLGLPLLRQSAEAAGGELAMISRPGTGTLIRVEFRLNHPDLKPLGDMEGTVDLLRKYHPEISFELEWRKV